MAEPLTQEREAEIRARLAHVAADWPKANLLEEAAIDLLTEIDRLRAALADAEARRREAGLRAAADRVRAFSGNGKFCSARDAELVEHLAGEILSLIGKPADGWLPIEMAKKDGTTILALFHADIYPRLRPQRPDLEPWNGRMVIIRHPGIAPASERLSRFDPGWSIAAPVGHGGFPDEWIAGWQPLPPPKGGDKP